ncbi:MAG: NnrU family protein [Myxococcota bacterium]|nr:NnrU family protein [Myxococcota bacterium]
MGLDPMIWLALGLLVWSGAHLLKSVAPDLRGRLGTAVGEGPYRGLFSLVILASIALMVIGWRSTPPTLLYVPPEWGRLAAILAMVVAVVLFAASGVPTNLKRVIRHPQLCGVVVWAVGHLLANGESRSLLLFGGIGAWAVLSMLAINRRDGAYEKPDALPFHAEWKPLVGGAVFFTVLYFGHPWFAGVSPVPF